MRRNYFKENSIRQIQIHKTHSCINNTADTQTTYIPVTTRYCVAYVTECAVVFVAYRTHRVNTTCTRTPCALAHVYAKREECSASGKRALLFAESERILLRGVGRLDEACRAPEWSSLLPPTSPNKSALKPHCNLRNHALALTLCQLLADRKKICTGRVTTSFMRLCA